MENIKLTDEKKKIINRYKHYLKAVVGDDAYGEDKSVNKLQSYCKELFHVEDALFVTSGMLANRLAILTQTSPGDEVITDYSYHINFFDSAAAARMAVEHLIKLGHRRIAHLSGQLNPSTGIGRFAGYRDALLDAGISFDQDLVAVSGYTIKGGADAMHEILKKNTRLPTAIFPITLSAATGALMALHQHGIRVPEDMSLATVHDGLIAQVMYPPLTTVQMPVEQMGYDGVVSLIELIQGRRKSVDIKMSPLQLIIRGSTTRPAMVAD